MILTAGDQPGDFDYEVQIATDLPSGGMTTCHIRGTITGNAGDDRARRRPG